MPIFDAAIFDNAIFDTGGAAAPAAPTEGNAWIKPPLPVGLFRLVRDYLEAKLFDG